MILKERVASAVAAGEINVAFRRWQSLRIAEGDTFRSTAGVIRITSIKVVREDEIDLADAHAAGYKALNDLLATFRGRNSDPVYRIGLEWAGPDPRDALASNDSLSDADITEIDEWLDRLDSRTPWARATLRRIAEQPGVRAGELAASLTIDKESLKRRIRCNLKEKGLTLSLPEGYEVSPRGRAFLRAQDGAQGDSQ